MDKAQRTEIINKFARKEGDTGSPEVQIALLSGRISELTEHEGEPEGSQHPPWTAGDGEFAQEAAQLSCP